MCAQKITLERDFDETAVKVGHVLWYENDEIDNPEPHPHVVVAVEDNFIYTVCGTSRQDTVERIAKNLGLPDYSLFPAIGPTKGNTLSKATYFDCRDSYEIHRNDLQDKFQSGEVVKADGTVTYGEYIQIRDAMNQCSTIDIKDILIHPEDN